jgi:hypothetical protein
MTCQTCFIIIIITSNHILWQLTHTFQHKNDPRVTANSGRISALFVHVPVWHYTRYMQHTPTAEATTQITYRGSRMTIQSSQSARLNWGNSIRPLELRIRYGGYVQWAPNFRMHNSFICTKIAAWSLSAVQDTPLNIHGFTFFCYTISPLQVYKYNLCTLT